MGLEQLCLGLKENRKKDRLWDKENCTSRKEFRDVDMSGKLIQICAEKKLPASGF